jgi:5'-deoxy-5'-methylthioadenosine phosphorylase
MLAIIGGSGFARLAALSDTRREIIRTPYGEPSAALTFGALHGNPVVFLARHGYGHTIPPHEINYRANLWALHAQEVKHVLAVAAVGGIRADLVTGSLVLPDQIIDYTHGRAATFYTRGERTVRHIDFTDPYCEPMRLACRDAAQAAGVALIEGGTYAATQGPRLETAAEIDRLERDGADMVGMTGMPEAALARELGLCYATIAVIANPAAGRDPRAQCIDIDDINVVLEPAMEKVCRIIDRLKVPRGS